MVGPLKPTLNRSQDTLFVIKLGGEQSSEEWGGGRLGFGELGQPGEQQAGLSTGGDQQSVRPEIRQLAFAQLSQRVDCNLAHSLNERDSQHQRQGPKFTDRQGADLLIGFHETHNDLGADPAVGVGDQLAGEVVHPRQAQALLVQQAGQLAVEVPRQVDLDIGHVAFNHVFIVEHPLGRWTEGLAHGSRLAQVPADGMDLQPGLIEANEQRLFCPAAGVDSVLLGKPAGVGLELRRRERHPDGVST